MTYSYPTSANLVSSNGFVNFFGWLNSVTNWWFSYMVVLAFYVIVLIAYSKANDDDYASGLGVAGFVTFVVSLLFWLGDMVNNITFGVVIAMAIIGAVVLFVSKKD